MSMQTPPPSYPRATFVSEAEERSRRGLGRKLSTRTLQHLQAAEREIVEAAEKPTTNEMNDHFVKAHEQAKQICTDEDETVLREHGFLMPLGLRISPSGDANLIEGFDPSRYMGFLMELPENAEGQLTPEAIVKKGRVDKARQHFFIADYVQEDLNDNIAPAWKKAWDARHQQPQPEARTRVEADRASNSSRQSHRQGTQEQVAKSSTAKSPDKQRKGLGHLLKTKIFRFDK